MVEEEIDYEQATGLPSFARDPLGLLKRRWRWMLGVFLLGVAASFAFVATVKPRYRASASLLIASQRIPEDFVRTTVPDDILQRVDGLVAQALTREQLGQLVEQFGLYEHLQETETRAQLAVRARQDLFIELDPSMNRRRNRESSLIFSVAFVADDPQTAADVANEIVGLIQNEAVRLRTEQGRLTTGFLRRALEETERELRAQESLITEFKRRHRGALPSELQANLSKLERLQQQRDSLASQIAEAATRVAMLSTAGRDVLTTPDSRLLALRAELTRERAQKTEAHPDIATLRRQIDELEAAISTAPPENGSTAASGTPNALVAVEQRMLAELRAQLASTEREIRELDERVGEMPARAEEFEALDQKAVVLRESYLEFLRKVEDSELSESLERAQQGQRVSILNRATSSKRPERNRIKYLAAGLFASLAAAAAAGMLLEAIDPVLFDVRHTEAETGLAVVGSVPRIG